MEPRHVCLLTHIAKKAFEGSGAKLVFEDINIDLLGNQSRKAGVLWS